MTSTLNHQPASTTTSTPAETTRPSALRRTAVGVTGFFACALPTVWTISMSRFLLTGELSDHRFHQLTGQGLILCALWLASLVPLVRAGWAGRRPSPAAGLLHLTFVLSGAVCAVAAPQGGAPALMVIIAITGALLWLAMPKGPQVLSVSGQVDPVLAPVALLTAAFYTPYVVEQIGLQHAAVGHHAMNPHFFDMAWLTLALTVLAVLAGTVPAARGMVWWTAGASVVIGAAGLAFGEPTLWSLLALGLGVLAGAAALLRRSLDRRG